MPLGEQNMGGDGGRETWGALEDWDVMRGMSK